MVIVHTKDTMSDIYLDAVKIRHQVFVQEQGVPLNREIDKDEAYAIHFVLYEDGHPLATARLLPLADHKIKLQRMAVVKTSRGKGLGLKVIQAAEIFAKEQHFTEIFLGAQLTAEAFYQKAGYLPYGKTFLDAGIQHIAMKKRL